MKHTPAPWYTNPRKKEGQGLIIAEETGENIAVSYDAKNAALIAAAPELFTALDNAVALLGCYQAGTEVPPAVLANMIYEARAAIAKAKGE